MRKSQFCSLSTFSNGEKSFQHVVHAKGYGSMVHSGLMHYLSILYEEKTKTPKNHKKGSVYHNIQLDISNCYTFCIKKEDTDNIQKQI